jgi:hypothetical protein
LKEALTRRDGFERARRGQREVATRGVDLDGEPVSLELGQPGAAWAAAAERGLAFRGTGAPATLSG